MTSGRSGVKRQPPHSKLEASEDNFTCVPHFSTVGNLAKNQGNASGISPFGEQEIVLTWQEELLEAREIA